jgi:hypothetical protein
MESEAGVDMARHIVAVLVLTAMQGGSCGNGCAHTGGLHHAGPVASLSGHPVSAVGSGHPVSPVASASHPASALATTGMSVARRVALPQVGGDSHPDEIVSDIADTVWTIMMAIVQTPIEIAPLAPAPLRDDVPLPCHGVADCGDGALQQGAVCDRSAHRGDVDAIGICRDACRDDRDCPSGFGCLFGLDPTDRTWGGCREE